MITLGFEMTNLMEKNTINCYCYFSLQIYILPGIGEEDCAQKESWAAPVNSNLKMCYLLPNIHYLLISFWFL